jgi:capsule polysaccharide export protein KpsE/RkpR
MLSYELSSCHSSMFVLKSANDDLNARIEKLNVSSSSSEHVSFCNRCKDFDIDACNDHISMISRLNDDIAKLYAQLQTYKDDCGNKIC